MGITYDPNLLFTLSTSGTQISPLFQRLLSRVPAFKKMCFGVSVEERFPSFYANVAFQ